MKYANGVDAFEPDRGERVRAIRLSTGRSQADFHRWLVTQGINVTYATWNQYERGGAMYWHTAVLLCDLFPITMDYIYRNTEESREIMRLFLERAALVKEEQELLAALAKKQAEVAEAQENLIKTPPSASARLRPVPG